MIEPTTQPAQAPPEAEPQEFPVNIAAFPGLTEDAVISWSKKCNESWKSFFEGGTNPESRRIELYNKLFLCQNLDTRMPHLPIPNSIIETYHANVMQVLSKRPKVVEAKAKFMTADNDAQRLIEDLANQEILFQEDARRKISAIVKNAAITEYSIVHSLWERYSFWDINPQYEAPNGVQKVTQEGQVEVQKGRWIYEQVSEPNFAFDPDCISGLDKASWTRHRDFKTVSSLLRDQQDGKLQNVDALMDKASSSTTADPKNKTEQQQQALGAGKNEGPEKKVQIDEFYAVISWEAEAEDGSKKWQAQRFHFMVAGEDKLIMFDACDLKPDRNPYILVRVATRPNSPFGNSVLLPVVDLEEQANNSTAQKRALVNKAADNPGFYEPASGFDPSKQKGRVSGWIMVADASRVKRLEVDAKPIEILNSDISQAITMMRESTPANEQFQGNGPQENTATQANLDYQAGGTRFAESVDTVSNDLFPQLAREFFWQAKQYSQDGDLFVAQSSIDGLVRPVTLADLTGEWDFIASSMTTEANRKSNNEAKLAIANQMVEIQMKAPQMMVNDQGQQVAFNMEKLFTEELLPSVGIRTGQNWIRVLPPPMPMMPGMPPGPGGPPPGPPGSPIAPGMALPPPPPEPHPTASHPLPVGVR